MKGLIVALSVLAAGCDKRPAPPTEQVPPEVASAVQEVFAFLDAPEPDPSEVCRRAGALARGYYPQQKANGFLARPSKSTVSEALFLVCFGSELQDKLRAPIALRVASLAVEKLSGYPEAPELVRAAWKAIVSHTSPFEDPKAREVCAALSAQLWGRMKERDPAIQKIYKRIVSSGGGAVLTPILDGQLSVDLVVEATRPVPLGEGGKPRFTVEMVEAAAQKAFQEILSASFAKMGADRSLYDRSLWLRRPGAAPAPVTLRVRYAMEESGKTLTDKLTNSRDFKALVIDLRLQFEQDGKPMGAEMKLRAVTPDKISWDEYKEGPEAALLQSTLFQGSGAAIDLLVNPR